jgi:ribose 5-phosphate isomerase A
VLPFQGIERLDLAIDGADQVDSRRWLVKGGGGAHPWEKIVAAAADRFVVIVSANKVVDQVSSPVPVELLPFGLDATLRSVPGLRLRGAPRSPDGGEIGDWWDDLTDPAQAAAYLASVPGIVGHGLFPPSMVTDVLIGRDGDVEHRPTA